MITVRFPSGLSIQYNDAKFVYRSSEYSDLYESSAKKKWFAQIPNTAVIEVVAPCRVYNAHSDAEVGMALEALEKEVRGLKRMVRELKKGGVK